MQKSVLLLILTLTFTLGCTSRYATTEGSTTSIELQGVLYWNDSEEPVEGAVVKVENVDGIRSKTDKKGKFILILPKNGSYTIVALDEEGRKIHEGRLLAPRNSRNLYLTLFAER